MIWLSAASAQVIATEVRKLIDTALAQAWSILAVRRVQLDTVPGGLLRYETRSGEDIAGLLAGKTPVREVAEAAAIA